MKDKNRMRTAIAVLLLVSLLNTAVSSTVIENRLNKNFNGINWNEEHEEKLITPNSQFFLEKPCAGLADNISVCKVIIQLNDEPVLNYAIEQRAELQIQDKREINAVAKTYENSISITHLAVKKEINQNNISIRFTREYHNLFNGFAAEISTEDIAELENISYIKAVFPDRKISALLTDSVQLINATEVWQIQNASGVNITGINVKVAIIDTGIDYMHPDLGGGFGPDYKVTDGWDFVNNDPDPMDDNGHGTHVAGIVAANGSIRGIAPDSQLRAYKALDYEGIGYMSDIIASIEKAVDPDSNPFTDDGADIISISSGGIGDPDDPVSQAVDNAVDYGIVVIVTAGNEGPSTSTILSPGTARKAITVGATNKLDDIAWFSSRGPVVWNGKIIVKPDLVAPGVNINSTVPDGSCSLCSNSGYMTLNGTSMATPMVTGTAALLMQMNPHWSPGEIKMALRITAKDLSYDVNTQGYGRIDAYQAVTLDSAPPIAVLDTSGTVKGSINILGTAAGNGFVNYTIEYGTGDGNWHYIGSSDSQVNDDVLVVDWNTTEIDAGKYFLQLTVRSTSGLSSEDRTMIYVGSGSVCNLDTGEEFLTIQGAIDATNTSDGHTIIVNPGSYYENVNVTKQLFLRGVEIEGKKPVVDALGNGNAITLSADGVTLEGFTTKRSSNYCAGIRVNSNNNTITGNIAYDNGYGNGIYLEYSTNTKIIGNTVYSNWHGIDLIFSNYNTIKGNTAHYNRCRGISLFSSNNNNIIDNIARSNNADGIRLLNSSNNNIECNTVKWNSVRGLELDHSSNNTVKRNTFENDGLIVHYAYNNTVEDNLVNNNPLVYLENNSNTTVTDAGQVILVNCNNITVEKLSLSKTSVGIELWQTEDSIISNNSISENGGDGIYISYSGNNTIEGNTLNSNGWYGIRLRYSDNNTLSDNTASYNRYNGIDLICSSSCIITNNIANYNIVGGLFRSSTGIRLISSENSTIIGNMANNNYFCGISLRGFSNNTTIIGNTASDNTYGIILDGPIKNTIKSNTFVNDGLIVCNSYQNSIEDNVVNNKPLVYLENNSNTTVTDAGQVILVNCNNITVEKLNLSKTSIGIEVWQTEDSTISNNHISNNNMDGILLVSSNKSTIIGNNVSINNNVGIEVWQTEDSTISDNHISNNNMEGILLVSSNKNILYFNNFINNKDNVNSYYSVNIWNSTKPITYQYKDSTYTNYLGNYWSDYTGVDADDDGIGDTPYAIGSDSDNYPLMPDVSVINLYTVCPDGSCDYTVIQEAIDNASAGDTIEVYSGTYPENVDINKQLILQGIDTGGGIPFINGEVSFIANRITLEGFTVTADCTDCICVRVHGNNNTIKNNNISNNDEEGIYLSGSYNNIIGNTLNNNDYGIYLYNSRNNIIKYNIINNNNVRGISLSQSSDNNIIIGNTLINNNNSVNSALSIKDSSNNIIYNNFLNNFNNAYDNSNNIWNISKRSGTNIIGGPYLGGNYWSDYSGEDADVDGFGDTVYIIPGGSNKDHLPLVYRICGDVDGNTVVNTEDMQLMLDHIFTGAVIRDWAGDVDGSRNINILDVRLLMNHISDQALYPLNCTCIDVDLIISNITAASGMNYILDTLDIGKLQYIDRDYIFNKVPFSYTGLNYIMTANDDKYSTDNLFLEFDVNRDVTVYIAHDDRISPKPLWFDSFTDTGDNLIGEGGNFSLYANNFCAGNISLGGNYGSHYSSMYNVVIAPRTG